MMVAAWHAELLAVQVPSVSDLDSSESDAAASVSSPALQSGWPGSLVLERELQSL
jgi:hypothetical protein